MKVDNIMTSPVHSCSPEDNLRTAAQIMWNADCGCVVVTDDERIVGVITDRDICMAANLTAGPLGNTTVGEVMSLTPHTCKPDDTIEEVTAIMAEHQLRRVPVADDAGHVVGLLSLNDLALASRGGRSNGISSATVGDTLAAICQHRPSPGSSEPH